ncbi:hypothetical protein, partial [Aeromonas enteropelogenes]|uniref:hypothetical protein n=1 Tax=Aeromonas enteropelogenes TaxID=29489 RepID=UPI003BA1F6AF
QKAPSVAVTRGWGSHDLLADLGNNAPLHRIIYRLHFRVESNLLTIGYVLCAKEILKMIYFLYH